MNRQRKYPETDTFTFYNANSHKRIGGDCVVRAIATALGQSWEQTVMELTEVGIKYGYVLNDVHTYSKYLESKGMKKHAQPRMGDNTKYTGEEWCKILSKISKVDKPIVAHIGGHHLVCIMPKDGKYKVHDIWDSTDGCVGNYWCMD